MIHGNRSFLWVPATALLVLVAISPVGAIETAGTLFVDLDAATLSPGDTVWTNAGTYTDFEAAGAPEVGVIETTPFVLFDGVDDAFFGMDVAPDGLVGLDPTRSIEVWALNEAIGGEETLVSWGHRGGPQGTNMAFNYGNNGSFGAVGHWGSPDLGWNDAGGAPAADEWHHLVYTYDEETTRVYADGALSNSEMTIDLGGLDTYDNTPIAIASQWNDDGSALNGALKGSLAIGRVRIHDDVLTDAQILANYNEEKDDFINPPPTPPPPPPPPPELVGLWRFDDANALGKDSSQLANDLVPDGGVDYDADGKFDGAADFDGFDGMLIPDDGFPDGVPTGNDPYTIALWMRPNAPTNANGQPSGMIGWGAYGSGRSVNAFRIFQNNGFRHYWWGADLDAQDADVDDLGVDLVDGEWHHAVALYDGETRELYLDGEPLVSDSPGANNAQPDNFAIGRTATNFDEFFDGMLDDVAIFDGALDESQILAIMDGNFSEFGVGGVGLQAGDADMDLDFDQVDIVQVQIAGKYTTGQAATWGEGDWNGAPGGEPGNPPPGNGLFDQLDIVAALTADKYLMGKYAALGSDGKPEDGQTSIGYNAKTGEVWVDAPAGTQLTSVNVDSAAGIFTGDPALNLDGSFDQDVDNNIFKATFGSSFGSMSFGNVAQAGLSEEFLLGDVSVIGSLAGGGGLGDVDLIYVPVPEPATALLLGLAMIGALPTIRRLRRGG